MDKQLLIVGGGIGGLASAFACARAGRSVQLFERAPEFGEVGAGIQLGPNVTRILHRWGLEEQLAAVAAFPESLRVRSASTSRVLGQLELGARAVATYGAPYVTIHRADIHKILLDSVKQQRNVQLHLGKWLESFVDTGTEIHADFMGAKQVLAEGMIGADGVWSTVRHQLLHDARPRLTGHLAYRGMMPQRDLPAYLRTLKVTVWVGPNLHVVQYPVRGGQWVNVVAIVKGEVTSDWHSWDHAAHAEHLQQALGHTCLRLQDLVSAIPNWRLWPLCDRPPLVGAHEHARGRVALVGDAAHPMRPYMAQGAGMAIEDAACLERLLQGEKRPIAEVFQTFAQQRWKRNAKVQARAIRNGEIFHASGLLAWGRDAALGLMGARVMDVPWLYRE